MAETSSLSKKDILSIGFSAIALLLSLIAAYYNFFRQVNDVQVRVADFALENAGKPAENRIITHLAFINRGNQPALVTGAEWIAASKVDLSDGSFGGPCDTPPDTFPFVLEKGQMRLIRITSSGGNVEANSGQDKLLHYGIKIASINSQANEYGVQLFYGKIYLEQSKITTTDFDHSVIGLFGNADVAFRMAR